MFRAAVLSRAQAYILANTSVSGKSTKSIPWGKLLSRKEVWAIIVCHFCHNWGTFILLTWMPTYYNQVRCCWV
jgi:ACS family sodium-dependent inorganic phosphate cotransporter